MKYELIKLPYELNALEPVLSAETLEYHHGKHLQAYVNNLNALIEGTEYENMSLEDTIAKSEGGIFNNAGQVLNHNLYFLQFAPNSGGAPKGALLKAIEAQWGSFETFKEEFTKACLTLFGSGWAWLASDKEGKLHICKEANGSNPIAQGLNPILAVDVWEHAYYVDYRNSRPNHVSALWDIINWEVVEKRY